MEPLTHPHWEALTSATQDAFHLLEKLELIKRFYLAGELGWHFTSVIVFL
jgi:hypothetical protein